MSNSVFRGFLEIENSRESSATLISSFCDIYEPATKVFVLNNHASFSFCVEEVAYVIGMENTGTVLKRLQRIAENQARLKAMGLPQMVTSLKKSTPINKKKKKKGKKKVEDDDEEYKPENEEEQDPESDSESSSEEQHEHDSDFKNVSGSRKRKAKKKSLKVKSRVTRKKHSGNSDYIDEDEALMQAIALSLQDSAEPSFPSNKNVGNISKAEKNENIHIQEDKGRKKNKNSFASRLQMTEDELIVHFFQLDEAGKGTVTIRDLERAAIAHDFAWTDKELVDMIRCFDSDRDGKLSLDDFRKIVVRCNMIKGSENS